MKIITLTKGRVTIVDDDVFDELSKHKWCFSGKYAKRAVSTPKIKTVLMHRVIMNTPEGMETDHINCDKLDNRRENLRICTRAENKRNTGKLPNNTSGYKGVSWSKAKNKWEVVISVNDKLIHLGRFNNIIDAAHVYDAGARKYHGEFANTNFAEGSHVIFR